MNGTGTSSESASPGRCSLAQQRRPGRHQVTARVKWDKEVNKVVMECFYRSKPFNEEGKPIRGYRQRLFWEWNERGMFESTEQRVCDQARAVRKNGWLSELELEEIRRKIEHESRGNDLEREEAIDEANDQVNDQAETTTENYIVNEDNIGIDVMTDIGEVEEGDGNLSEEHKQIIEELKEMTREGKTCQGIIFKNVDKSTLKSQTAKVNAVIAHIKTKNITETNNLIRAASVWIAERMGLNKLELKEKKEPWWKRRIEGDIKRLKKDICKLDRKAKGEMGPVKSCKLKDLEEKYRVKKKGIRTVIEELKQRIVAKSAKVKRYEQRTTQFRLNRTFNVDQKKVYTELNGGVNRTNDVPNDEESRKFWGDIWSVEKEHNKDAEWLKELKEEMKNENHSQNRMLITIDKIRKQCRKMPNWKAPGKDKVQGYWIKNLTKMHNRIAEQLNKILMGEDDLPEWMTYGHTVLCQKDVTKGNTVDNYRPITCLPLMWKLMTGVISEEMYNYLENERLLPEEQKGCRRKSRGTKDQLLIDKTVLKDCKRRHTNLAMAWIDYRKAYDFVPHSWIKECMEMFGIADNVRDFLSRSMKYWKLSLCSNGVQLGDVKVNRGIFQGDSLSPLIFVLAMIPMSLLLRKVKAKYEWGKKEFSLNHLLFMDDLKLYGKDEDQIDSLVRTVHIISSDIGMEFGLKKCGVLTLKRGKIARCEGIVLPNGEVMKEVEEDGYTYLGIVELDKIKEQEMKDKTITEYKRRLRLILKSKLNGKNKITAVNTWAVAIFRYGAGIIDWRDNELKSIDRKTRKTMTMYGALHPRSDVDRLYVKRKNGGRGLSSIEQVVRGEENSLGFYVLNSEETLIKGVRASETINTEGTINSNDFKRQKSQELKDRWSEKRMYGQFIRNRPEEVDREKSWTWLSRGDLKPETEALLCAAQEQALRTNYVKYHIDKTADTSLCRLCGKSGESVQHIVSGCEKLAQREYKRRHDNVARKVHWDLCRKHGLEHHEKWYEHSPEGVVENDEVKILWDINIQCDNVITARRPDIVIINKQERLCTIVDVAIPTDVRVSDKEKEKIEKYQDLKREIARLWKIRKVQIIPIVIGALGSVTKEFNKWVEKLGIPCEFMGMQKTALLGTARILRKVLET